MCQSYQIAITNVAAAKPAKVYAGDTTAFGYVANLLAKSRQIEWNHDLIHPLHLGVERLGKIC